MNGRHAMLVTVALALLLTSCASCASCATPRPSTAGPSTPATATSSSVSASPAVTTSPAQSRSLQPRPSPQITSGVAPAEAVSSVRTFWRLVGQRRFAAARALIVPGSPLAGDDERWGIRRATLLAVHPEQLFAHPESYATLELPVEVDVVASSESAWEPTGKHTLWMVVTRMSDDTWRVYETGSGP